MTRKVVVLAYVMANAVVLFWASEVITRYPSSRYVLFIVMCIIVSMLFCMKLPKSMTLVSLVALGAVCGHVVSMIVNLGLETAYIPHTAENFVRMLSREPGTLLVGLLGFPALLGGWLQGVLAVVLVWILRKHDDNLLVINGARPS